MKLIKLILFSLLVFAWWNPALAQADDGSKPDPVILTDEQDKYPLGLHLEILEDPGGELTIEDVVSPEFNARFATSQAETPNYGFTESAFWVRLDLHSESQQTDNWLLELGFANMQLVDLYTPLPAGDGFSVKESGSMRPVSTRDVLYPHIVLELEIPSGSQQIVYLRLQSGASMTLALTLWAKDAFAAHAQSELALNALFFGALLALLVYHVFLAYSLREATYLSFVFLLGSLLVVQVSYAGYLEVYLFPKLVSSKLLYFPISFGLLFASIVLFSTAFLEMRTRLSRLYWVSIALVAGWGGLILLTPFVSYYRIAVLMSSFALISLVAALVAGITIWRQGFHPARFFLVAWLGALASLVLLLLVRQGRVPSTIVSENAYLVAFLWMAFCWSIALASRISLLKAQTEAANSELRSSAHRLSEILEGLPLGVVVYDKDNKPNYVNRRVTEILSNPAQGIEPDLSAGRTLEQAMAYFSLVVAGSDQEYPLERMPIYRALQGERATAHDIEANLVDRRVPLEIWASPVRDNAGNVEAAVVAFQDISDRKRAEMDLRASERRFRVIVENNFDGIAFLDRNRKVLYVSPSYSQLNGMSPKEMVGQFGVSFLHPEDQARIAGVFAEALRQSGRRVSAEYRTRHQDGSWRWIETRAANLLDDPRVEAVILNSRDITERKQADAKLEEYRRHLESLVEKRTAELSATNAWLFALNEVRQTVAGAFDVPQADDELSATILELLGARAVFILRWDANGEQVDAVCRLQSEGAVRRLGEMAAIAQNGSPLRQEIELGKPITLPAEQAASLLAPLGTCFQEDGLQFLSLAPMIDRQSVTGVLGTAIPTTQEFEEAQAKLVETMARDLADLASDAELLDQARALVRIEERNRLARDLHDSVTQTLFTASVLAEATPRIWEKDQGIARKNMEKLSVLLRGTLAEMRTLLLELRSGQMDGQPLNELLTTLVEAVQGRSHVVVTLTIGDESELPENVTRAYYRIAREALNNIIVHADATQASVSFSSERSVAKLRIWDNGRGFEPQEVPTGHLGISIMTERAAQVGGILRIQSEPGHGTEIVVSWSGNKEELGTHG